MNVEIENGQIVGYTQISEWSKLHNVSAYSLVRKIKEGVVDKDNFIRLGNITYIKNTFVPPSELNIQKPEKNIIRYHVTNNFPNCSDKEMYEIIDKKLGHNKLAKKIICALKKSDRIKNFDDLAKWINDCRIVKYINCEEFMQPAGRYIYGLGKESYNALRDIFISNNGKGVDREYGI